MKPSLDGWEGVHEWVFIIVVRDTHVLAMQFYDGGNKTQHCSLLHRSCQEYFPLAHHAWKMPLVEVRQSLIINSCLNLWLDLELNCWKMFGVGNTPLWYKYWMTPGGSSDATWLTSGSNSGKDSISITWLIEWERILFLAWFHSMLSTWRFFIARCMPTHLIQFSRHSSGAYLRNWWVDVSYESLWFCYDEVSWNGALLPSYIKLIPSIQRIIDQDGSTKLFTCTLYAWRKSY